MCSLTNNLVDPSPRLSLSKPPYFYLDLFLNMPVVLYGESMSSSLTYITEY